MTRPDISARQSGFTLIETLIALLIMGVMTSAMLTLIGQNTRFSAQAEDRVIAAILADNIMVETLSNPLPLERGRRYQPATLGERDWVYERIIDETSIEGVVSVTIKVRREGSDQVRSEITTLKSERG